GANKSITRTPVRKGFWTRALCIAGGAADSDETARGPGIRAPFPSRATPRALMTRPFQVGSGANDSGGIRNATEPRPPLKYRSNGLTIIPSLSMRITSPIWGRPVDFTPISSPSLTKWDNPDTRKWVGAISEIAPLTLANG